MRSSRQTSKKVVQKAQKVPKAKKPKIIFPVACRLLKDLGEDGFARISVASVAAIMSILMTVPSSPATMT